MMKYALITGSNGGVGKSLTYGLLNKGYYVFGIDLNNDIVNSNFKFIKCDITNENDINNAYNEVLKETNHLDFILNVAGIFIFKSLVEGDEEDLRKILDINFFGTYRINKRFFNMLDSKSRILVFSSEVALYSPQPFMGYYSLSKIILDRYADVLRRELNYLKIKVIKVESGAIKTKLLDSVNSKYEDLVQNSKYYKKPLTKLKKLMDDEICKQTKPELISEKLVKIIEKKNPKIKYKIKNSFKLTFLNILPEKLQDIIYLNVIK